MVILFMLRCGRWCPSTPLHDVSFLPYSNLRNHPFASPLSRLSPLGTIGAQHHLFLSQPHATRHHSLRRHNPHHQAFLYLTLKCLLVLHVLKEGVWPSFPQFLCKLSALRLLTAFWGAPVETIVNRHRAPLCHICVYVYCFNRYSIVRQADKVA